MFEEILRNVKKTTPLVHSITNYVTVNDCANIILAAGGSPIMADDIHEVRDIVKICHVLSVNMGTLNETSIKAMIEAGIAANERGRPVVLDPVAVGASEYRNESTKRFLEQVSCTVIRGNSSEIKALAYGSGKTSGVDANIDDIVTEDSIEKTVAFAKELSAKTKAVIAISGKYDIITDKDTAYIVTNGVEEMTKITGSGCMLTTLIAAYCGANPSNPLKAAVAAVCAIGLCGELAKAKMLREDTGLSSFRTYMIDYMSRLDEKVLEKGARYEIR